jgi:VWFA-related protein
VRLSLLALCLASSAAQQLPNSPVQSPNPPVPTLTAVARRVVLDIAVVDAKGRPIKGLKQTDFSLLEDGVPQTFKSFEEHTATSAPSSYTQPKLPPNTFTNYAVAPNSSASTIILMDVLDTSIEAQMYLHEQVVEYMKKVQPGTSMAIFMLDARLHLLQGFTTNPQQLLDAVKSKRDDPHFGPYSGPNYIAQRFRHDILTQALQELGRYLAGFPGRKNLIWFNGYVPHALYSTGIGNPFHDSAAFDDNDIGPNDFAQTSDVLTLSRVAVYPVDARGLIAPRGGRDPHLGNALEYNRETLEQVADATGGKAFYNTNGLKDAIAEVVDTGSNYYTVSYTPTDKNWDGSVRHIKVELPADLRYNLEYRHAYKARNRERQEERHLAKMQNSTSAVFVPTAETPSDGPPGIIIHKGDQESLQSSMTLGAIPPTELIFAASLKPASNILQIPKNTPLPPDNFLRPNFANKPFRDIDILYATDARKLALNPGPDGIRRDLLDFVAVVYNDQGEVVNSIITAVDLALKPETYRRLAETGFSMTQRIAVPVKGNYFLRIGLRDNATDNVGALEIPVEQIKPGIAGAGQSPTP